MEDFIYSKTTHLGYIRDRRAGLSALAIPETLSSSVPASRQQRGVIHAFKPVLKSFPGPGGKRVKRPRAEPAQLTRPPAGASRLESLLCRACRSMTHLWRTEGVKRRRGFQTHQKPSEITCHSFREGLLLLCEDRWSETDQIPSRAFRKTTTR